MVSSRRIRISTRGSELALWQAGAVAEALRTAHPGLETEIHVVRTTGDRITDVPLARIGGRGVFTKEVDDAVLNGDADIAVHSLKDVPTSLTVGLQIAAVWTREDPRDVLIRPSGQTGGGTDALPTAARVGTSSLRRRALLLALRPDLQVLDLRGNLNTRLAKLDAGGYDAIILAAAGVLRLGWAERISAFLDPPGWLPAVGQGALAVVARDGDQAVVSQLADLHDPHTAAATTAERALLRVLEGGCQVPIGALAVADSDTLCMQALISSLDGRTVVRGEIQGVPHESAALGERLAADLLANGGSDVLAGVRHALTAVPPAPAP